MGYHYAEGKGVPRDQGKAVFWYEKAAAAGDVKAQYNLGMLYLNGVGGKADDEKAAFFYRMAAGAGYGPAMYRLAVLYEEGRGVKQSYQLAGEWYERADLAAKVKIDEAMKKNPHPFVQRVLQVPDDLNQSSDKLPGH